MEHQMNTYRLLLMPMTRLGLVILLLLAVGGFAIGVSVAWSLAQGPSTSSPIQADPLNLVDVFHSAINSNDNAAMLNLFAEDATVMDSGLVFKGKEAIRNWASQSQRMAGLRLTLLHSQVAGEKVFWNDLAHNGPEVEHISYILRWTAVIQKG